MSRCTAYIFSEWKPKGMDSPVLIGLAVPGLLLHREKGRHQHNAGEAGIQEDREQQLRRKQLSCWSVWSQFR